MKLKRCFSTLACPAWSVSQIIDAAVLWEYDGIEFRVVLGELDLWQLPAFRGSRLLETRKALIDHQLALPCIDASARFDSPDPAVRQANLENALRIAELAAELGSPAIRVFGDRVQPGCSRTDTTAWLAESLSELQAKLLPANISVWLETHGDFSTSHAVADLLSKTEQGIQVIWDPANALQEFGESPRAAATAFGQSIRHVHLKDFRAKAGGFEYTLMGEGQMPTGDTRAVLESLEYRGFVSFEWEKHWHPELAGPGIALPHFAAWVRENWLV